MKKCICDFCENKEADRRYQVKRTYLTFPFGGPERVDICDDCYIDLFVPKKVGRAKLKKAEALNNREKGDAAKFQEGFEPLEPSEQLDERRTGEN